MRLGTQKVTSDRKYCLFKQNAEYTIYEKLYKNNHYIKKNSRTIMVLDIMRAEKDIQAHDLPIALRKVKGDFYIFMGFISPNPSAKN